MNTRKSIITETTTEPGAEANAAVTETVEVTETDTDRVARLHEENPEFHAHNLTADEIARLRKNVLV